MLDSINSFFDKYLKSSDQETDSEHNVDQLQLASAALMIEVSKADHNIDDVELVKISEILESKFSLAKETLNELFEMAKVEADNATSLYQFTTLINDSYSPEEKISLIKNMWEVAFIDGDLDKYEENIIRKVSDLLYVSHGDFIKTKLSLKK